MRREGHSGHGAFQLFSNGSVCGGHLVGGRPC